MTAEDRRIRNRLGGLTPEALSETRRILIRTIRRWPMNDVATADLRRALALLTPTVEAPETGSQTQDEASTGEVTS